MYTKEEIFHAMLKVDKLEEAASWWEKMGGILQEEGRDVCKIRCKDDLLYLLYSDPLWYQYKLSECKYIADMIMIQKWNALDVRIFHSIGTSIVVDNLSYFDKGDVLEEVGCKDTQFRVSLKKLEEEGMVKVMNNKLEKKTHRLVKVNPCAYWKGNYGVRKAYIEYWYQPVFGKTGYNPDISLEGRL